ncbi:hypothetical protein TNCV_4439831 [Trichonephila clavipes]|nr:hypothetical protein TNCV_4439831 [Trichonephila clavipes]
MQMNAPPYYANPVKRFLLTTFGEDTVIGQGCKKACPSKSRVGHLLTVACQTNLPIGFSVPHSRIFLKQFDYSDNACRGRE